MNDIDAIFPPIHIDDVCFRIWASDQGFDDLAELDAAQVDHLIKAYCEREEPEPIEAPIAPEDIQAAAADHARPPDGFVESWKVAGAGAIMTIFSLYADGKLDEKHVTKIDGKIWIARSYASRVRSLVRLHAGRAVGEGEIAS